MVAYEWIFDLFATSSDKIIANTKRESDAYYQPKLNEQAATIKQLASSIEHLKNILKQHNIPVIAPKASPQLC